MTNTKQARCPQKRQPLSALIRHVEHAHTPDRTVYVSEEETAQAGRRVRRETKGAFDIRVNGDQMFHKLQDPNQHASLGWVASQRRESRRPPARLPNWCTELELPLPEADSSCAQDNSKLGQVQGPEQDIQLLTKYVYTPTHDGARRVTWVT